MTTGGSLMAGIERLTITLAELKVEIDRGLADVVEGRVEKFDIDRIVQRGKKLLKHSSSV